MNQEAWPDDELEWVRHCPVCGSAKRRILYDGLRDRLFGAPGLWALWSCLSCGAAYLDPRPTRSSIGRAYARYYTHQVEESREDLGDLGLWRRLRRASTNGYLNRRFGTDYRPASRLAGFLVQFVPWKRHQLDALGRHLPRPRPGQSLLDVGCGNGAFLDLARRAGWQVMGVEPDPTAAAIARARGLDVRLGQIEFLDGMAEGFDVVTLSHVIEHVHDPIALLERCRVLLRPGGWLWIDTPNLKSFGHRRYGPAWMHLDPPRHLVLFTPNSLALALERAGYGSLQLAPWRPVASSTYPVSETIAASGAYEPAKPTSAIVSIRALWADIWSWRQGAAREFVTVVVRRAG